MTAPDPSSPFWVYLRGMKTSRAARLLIAALTVVAALAALPPGRATLAQNVSLDEGRFVIVQDGRRVGTESFWIRRAGTGTEARVIGKAEIALELADGRREIAHAVEARGADMLLAAYEASVTGDRHEEIAGRAAAAGRRFSARIASEQGEQVREFPLLPGTVVLDRGIAYQYFFIARLLDRAPLTLPIIAPRDRRHSRVRASVVGVEPVSVGGTTLQARHVRIEDEDGTVHHVWVGPGNRVLRVEIPASGYTAEREAL